MSFKKFLTKAGLIEEEVQVTPKATPVPQAPRATSATVTGLSTPVPSFTMTPAIDAGINQMLLQSLEENKLSGFDYMKFSSAVEEMKSFGAPEEARYKMAFSTAKQMGVDKAGLLKSGKHYLDVLSQDEADFNQDCSEYEKNEILAREAKLSQVESTISELSKQLAQAQQAHVTLKSELQEERTRLESRKASFQVTLQNLRSIIETNVQKINQYL